MATKRNTSAKRKTKLSSLGKQHVKDNLMRLYPFLRERDFRTLKESEMNESSVFEEFFPDETKESLDYLYAIHTFQQCDTKHKMTSISKSSENTQNESKI